MAIFCLRIPVRIAVLLILGIFGRLARAETTPVPSTICEIVRNPDRFDNKLVKLQATLAGNFEISAIHDPAHDDCGSLWFTYAGGGPEASVSINTLTPDAPRPVVQLRRDSAFQHFQDMVSTKMYPRKRGIGCMDCARYEVSATMTGMVEYAGPNKGFGHMNGFPVQFVLQSIEATSVKDLSSHYKASDFSVTPTCFPTGYISGILRDDQGRPVEDGDLTIYSATNPEAHIEDDSATTDAHGRFRFAVPPGKYVVGFNTFWPPSPKFPYAPTYYPSAPKQSLAVVIEVRDRQHLSNLLVRLPKPLTRRLVPITVLWPDGSPVDDANVWLSPKLDPTMVVGTSVSHTGKDGNFDLIGFQGIDYVLHADKYGGVARVSCIKPTLIRASQPLPVRMKLSLTVTEYGTCTNGAFEPPVEP
jgi:hypothetical protein